MRERSAPESASLPSSRDEVLTVPLDLGSFKDIAGGLPRRLVNNELIALIDDRRFAETIYRTALADGVMDRLRYQDPRDNV